MPLNNVFHIKLNLKLAFVEAGVHCSLASPTSNSLPLEEETRNLFPDSATHSDVNYNWCMALTKVHASVLFGFGMGGQNHSK